MKYRTLGRTGIKVSPYCLGAMMFGAVGNPDHDDSIRIIHKALDAGLNFIDTADAYSRGESEEIVGQALKDRRDDVVLATKAHRPMGDDPNQRGNSRRWLIRAARGLAAPAADRSRRPVTRSTGPTRTPTWRKPSPPSPTWCAAGKVRAIGSSTFPASDIVEAQWVAERRGLERFRTEQPPYSILDRGASSARCCPPASATAWARWSGARWARGLLTGRIPQGPADPTVTAPASASGSLSDERRARRRRAAHPPRRGRRDCR